MERRINSKIQLFKKQFKDDLCSRLKEMKTLDEISDSEINEFIGYIYDYDTLKLETEDFTKRKRVKNHVPLYERCCALKSNGKQCTRRKKDNEDFCGTHIKGSPHGIVENTNTNNDCLTKVDIWVEEIKGIQYYLDNDFIPNIISYLSIALDDVQIIINNDSTNSLSFCKIFEKEL